ncbi:MAG TPA: DUF2846 domain-containing protein [Stellaceae bacterium]|jgi:hypothetical protein
MSRFLRVLGPAALLAALAAAGCSSATAVDAASIPPVPPGKARIWVYRSFNPSESRNLATVLINGAVTGYAQPAGGAFYRDVVPGRYHIAVESFGRDTDQSSNVDLAAGQEAFVKIETLNAWTTSGDLGSFKRDTFYARLADPRIARTEVAHSTFDGGG